MRRKLIQQDAFDKITSKSVTNAERELMEAEDVLARALDERFLRLHSFTENTALFENVDGTYIHASYNVGNDHLAFSNIEELVIDESSKKAKMRSVLSEMLDHILKEEDGKAKQLFDDYLEMINWNEAKKVPAFLKGEKDDSGDDDDDDHKSKKKDKKKGEFPFKKKKGKKDPEEVAQEAGKKHGNPFKEAYRCATNVLDYVDYMKIGPALSESTAKTDDRGNVTDLMIPSYKLRNASKLLESDWKLANKRVKEGRDSAFDVAESEVFSKAMSDLRRQNAFSDQQGLEEVLENVAQAWPQLLYVTESELAGMISKALDNAGVNNYDDETCQFMAEGILYKVHEAYTDRVNQVLHLARASKVNEGVHPYTHFKHVTEGFYPSIDNKFGLEKRVFEDLYESLGVLYKKAERMGNKPLMYETASYLNELAAVLNDEAKPELDLVEDAAEFLGTVIETNLETGQWVVSNKPHLTISGDHPDMAKKASHPYAPSRDFSGNWGDPAPMIKQDDMSYKGNAPEQARNSSWASPSTGGGDVFPKLKNPYIPKPFGDYTMKGEKGVDKEAFGQHWATWSTGDTWPNLNNPYVPQEAGGPGGKGYKMKDGSETDLVVDR